jgi:hypothetical protein
VGGLVSARRKTGWRWRGRKVKLVDGTGISLPDTPQSQEWLHAQAFRTRLVS